MPIILYYCIKLARRITENDEAMRILKIQKEHEKEMELFLDKINVCE